MEKQDKAPKSGQKTSKSFKDKITRTCPDYSTRSKSSRTGWKQYFPFLSCHSWETEEEVFSNHLKPPLSWKWEPIHSASAFASFRVTVAAALCRRTVWWISKPKASVCILIIAGSLVSPLKQPEYSEWTTFSPPPTCGMGCLWGHCANRKVNYIRGIRVNVRGLTEAI